MTDINKDSESYNHPIELDRQYRYRRIYVKDGTIITTPAGTQCLQIRKAAKDRSFVEYLEPVCEG